MTIKATHGISQPHRGLPGKPITKPISQPDVESERASRYPTSPKRSSGLKPDSYPRFWLLGTKRDQCRTVILGFLVNLVT